MKKFVIHTNKGWWTGCGFSDHHPSAQRLDDFEEQKRKSHQMVVGGMEAHVMPADPKKMADVALHYANHR